MALPPPRIGLGISLGAPSEWRHGQVLRGGEELADVMKISWVTLDRFCEEQRGSDEMISRLIDDNDRPLRSSAAVLSDDQLLEKLESFGLHLDRDHLEELCAGALSAEEVARPLIDSCGFRSRHDRIQGDWVWICLATLWQRWWPEKVCLELLDDKIQDGYHLLERDEAACARTWLSAWSDVLRLCDATGVRSVAEFDDRFPMTQSLYNWSQDLEGSLWNAGLRDHGFLVARIAVCEEALRRFPHENQLMTENRRRALAETRFEVGETDKAEELFRTWLAADPRWGFGWVAWAVCHFSPAGRDRPRDYVKAERLLREGYSTPGVRDRDAIAAWLNVLYEETGRQLEARAFEQEAKKLRRQAKRKPCEKSKHKTRAVTVSERFELDDDGSDEAPVLRRRTTLTFGDRGLPLDQLPAIMAAVRTPAPPPALQHAPKIGRNAPCPCGSGKKFKKCCGTEPAGRPRPEPRDGGRS